ncbi:putative pheophorbide a oxygenase [Helianthus debilis subsp. tardiflorus]
MKFGQSNWQKVCFVPTKADANVVAYKKWIKKYAGGQIDWGNKFNELLPPTPPRDRLLDRYWSHVENCSCCNGAYKSLNALKVALQVFSVASVAIVAAAKQGMRSVAARNTLAVAALLCFVGSKWLSHFIYKNFHFHDYIHAFKLNEVVLSQKFLKIFCSSVFLYFVFCFILYHVYVWYIPTLISNFLVIFYHYMLIAATNHISLISYSSN